MQGFPEPRYPVIRKNPSDEEILSVARHLANSKEYRSNKVGFSAYGKVKEGDRVLLVADNLYDPRVVDSITEALREKGAKVDLLITDVGPDRQVNELDEIDFFICKSGEAEGRERELRLEVVWAWELAKRRNYDLLIQGAGGASAPGLNRHSGIPWPTVETFVSETTLFPSELNELINQVAWDMIWKEGRGGRVHLTDPEGTDLTWTLWDEYYERPNAYGFAEIPRLGHLFGHPISPLIEAQDDEGVLAGTTNHTGKPFPYIRILLKQGAVYKIEGGGKYGDAWRELLDETSDIHYPGRPRPGLFWLEEVAIGTHPKVFRPTNFLWRSSWMGMWERFRSGIIHVGLGTHGEDEEWGRKTKNIYGHIHVHLLFPTYEITKRDGQKIKVIDKGHLTALDHPIVRQAASKYGDPNKILSEAWIPSIPGINVKGDYTEDYAKDPVSWIRKELERYVLA
jgi:hypothetical protein